MEESFELGVRDNNNQQRLTPPPTPTIQLRPGQTTKTPSLIVGEAETLLLDQEDDDDFLSDDEEGHSMVVVGSSDQKVTFHGDYAINIEEEEDEDEEIVGIDIEERRSLIRHEQGRKKDNSTSQVSSPSSGFLLQPNQNKEGTIPTTSASIVHQQSGNSKRFSEQKTLVGSPTLSEIRLPTTTLNNPGSITSSPTKHPKPAMSPPGQKRRLKKSVSWIDQSQDGHDSVVFGAVTAVYAAPSREEYDRTPNRNSQMFFFPAREVDRGALCALLLISAIVIFGFAIFLVLLLLGTIRGG